MINISKRILFAGSRGMFNSTQYRTPFGVFHNPHRPTWTDSKTKYTYMQNGNRHNIVGQVTEQGTHYINGERI